MPSKGRTRHRGSGPALVALALVALVACALPSAASARMPIVSYLEGEKIKMYDLELGKDIAPLPVTVDDPAQIRYAVSFFGRYVFFTDGDKKLHLFNRAIGSEVPLPGIDVYANPGFLAVSDTGLVAFDDNANGPERVYDSRTGDFVTTTGLPAMDSGHRQTKLSGDGRFLATTCGPVDNCVVDLGTDSNPYVQNLSNGTDTGVPDDNDSDEEDPCINFSGNLVGWHAGNPTAGDQKDVFIYDRAASAFLTIPGLNSAADDESFCTMSPGGAYIGLMHEADGFKLFDRSTGSFLALPEKPFSSSSRANQILSAPIAFCGGIFAGIVGTPRADKLNGTPGVDVIAGLGGKDTIRGLKGNDVLCGNAGRDRIFGGKGKDRLLGGPGRDRLVGGKGKDKLRGGPGRDRQLQ